MLHGTGSRSNLAVLRIGLLLSLPFFQMSGQTSTGRIVGKAQDTTGAVIPDVQITAKRLDTGLERVAVSGADGTYAVPLLPPGRYDLTAKKTSFKTYVQGPITVLVNTDSTANISLEVGSITQSVEVNADASRVQTTSSTLSETIGTRQMEDLPLNGRNFAQLGLLQAGVTEANTKGVGSSFGTNANTFSVNGARTSDNNFLIDATTAGALEDNTLAFKLNPDAIQEFTIQTNTFSAEFGRQAGAIVNIVTKSGTNSLHGAAWEFLRNDKLDARNFFAATRAPHKQNQYGYAVGGPVIKNRTFFFTSWEWFPIRQGVTRATSVPTNAEKSGDFSALASPIIDPTTGRQFPGNVIPGSELDPVAVKLSSLYPQPTNPFASSGSNNFSSSPASPQDSQNVLARIDHQISEKDSLFGRFLYNKTSQVLPFQGPSNLPEFNGTNPSNGINFAIGETHIFSPVFINDFRAGFARNVSSATYFPIVPASDYGINFATPPGTGLPEIDIFGQAGLGNVEQGPNAFTTNSFQESDTLSLTRGAHTMRFGAQVVRTQENVFFRFIQNGQYSFTGLFTGNAFADFMLGRPQSFTLGIGRPNLYMRATSISGFFQDEWKVTRRLTVNLGLRYDYFQPLNDHRGETSVFFATTGPTPGVPQSGAGIVLPNGARGLGGTNSYFPDYKDLGPRVGFAYDLFGNGRASIRGGYGIFYGQLRNNLMLQQIFAFPWVSTLVVEAPTLANPLNGVALPGPPTFPQTSTNSLVAYTDPHIKTPYNEQYNLMLQTETHGFLFNLGYIGSQGHRLLQFQEMNQPIFIPGASTVENENARRPYAGFSSIMCSCGWASSNYNSVQFTVNRRFSSGVQLVSAFTFSKMIDDAAQFHAGGQNTYEAVTAANTYDLAAERATSSLDVPLRWVTSGLWDLPFGKGRSHLSQAHGVTQALLGGWQAVGIVTLRSGFPFTLRDFQDTSLTDGPFLHVGRPDLVAPQQTFQNPNLWYNPAAYARAPLGGFGNLGRNTLRGDGMGNLDFSILKDFPLSSIREGMAVEFRAEAFNLFNSPEFDFPNNDPSSPTAGQVGATINNPRQIQLALKLIF